MDVRHIILATDLSEAARFSYPHAASLAQTFGARLSVVHVDELCHLGAHTGAEVGRFLEKAEKARDAGLGRAVEDLNRLGIEPEVETLSGEPAHEILDFAERESGDLIVMCKHGVRGAAGRVVLGSTSFRVIHSARVPVLVVHAPEDEELVPEMVLPRYDRILTGTDFSEQSDAGLEVLLSLARRLDAKVSLVHVLRTPVFLPALPGEPPLYVPRETVSELHDKNEDRLSKLVDDLETGRVSYTVTVGEDVAETLVARAIDEGGKLIVLPSHGHGVLRVTLFGSTSKHVIKLSPLPVLVLPRDYLEGGEEEE
jgi:nucleotide-binding universal stress UspA family protein